MDGGVLWPITRALIALISVCLLAWVSLSWLSRRGFSGLGLSGPGSSTRLRLLERLALSPRRQLYVVQADSRVFLLAAADGGPVSLIAELQPSAAAGSTSQHPAEA